MLALGAVAMVAAMSCSCDSRPSGNADEDMDEYVSELMDRMSLQEKLGQLNLPSGGDLVTGHVIDVELAGMIRRQEIGGVFNVKGVDKIRELQRIAVEETDLAIPLLVGADIVHGYETIFPIPLALSCSWDTVAVERMARISAIEAGASGINWTYSPMVDICRDPRWGRIAEGNGEDPWLGSLLGAAYVRGYQGDGLKTNREIMACVKHFALYGAAEGGRDYNTVDMSTVRMFNEYLPPFKATVDAGVASVMNSFNLINGIPAAADKWLMVDVLRREWGFDGLLVTDYNSIGEMEKHGFATLDQASVRALEAGSDMDMVSCGYIGTLGKSLEEGKVSMSMINDACRRVLEAKYRLGLFADPYKYCDTTAVDRVYTAGHRDAARDIARETFVLLKNNDSLLPLRHEGRIALIGPLADAGNNMCGTWSMACDPSCHESLLSAMRREVAGDAEILYAKGSNIYYDEATEIAANSIRPIERGDNEALLAEALRTAAGADVIVAALGESTEMSGESASRTDIGLPDAQRELLRRLVATGKPVVLLLFTGRPLALEWENENVDAILNVWFGGSEAAQAIADVVFGKVAPCGRLTTTFPRSVGQIPVCYNHFNTGKPDPSPDVFNRYISNYIDCSNEPLYPFGFGLSYTSFDYSSLCLSDSTLKGGDTLMATVTVSNTGGYDAYEVVQLYLHDELASISRPVKELKGFKRIFLHRGESCDVTFEISRDMLGFYDRDLRYICEPGDFRLMIGPNSRDVLESRFTLVH